MKSIKNKILVLFFGLFIFALSACQIGDSGGGGAINKEIEYVVKFNDYDGTLLKEEKVKKNESATAPEDPVREGYIFTGWSEDFSNVTKNLTVVAEYEKHEHEYTTKVTDPTCLEKGYTTYTCSCGESYVDDYVDALGHNMITDERVEPTCVNTGLTEGSHCSRCDYTTCKEIAALNHNLVIHESKEATCTEKGWEVYECTRCDYTTYKEIAALNHNLVIHESKEATCTEKGWEVYGCTRCSYTTYREIVGDHNIVSTVIEPGLITEGYTIDSCSYCDYLYIHSYIPQILNLELEDDYYVVTGVNDSSIVDITIPETYNDLPVKAIGVEAFLNCTSLTNIEIPSSVTSIGSSAFESCYRLENVYYSGTIDDWCNIEFNDFYSNPMCELGYFFMLNESNEYFAVTDLVIPDTITSIGNYQFYGFNKLASITIPNSVTSIGEYAFNFCSSLTSIVIPNTVTSISSGAFSYCIRITNIMIPEGVTSIGEDAFSGCMRLESIVIPNSVTSIGEDAFRNCSSLTSITIPNRVISIGNSAFAGCYILESVYYSGTIEDWCNMEFDDSSSNLMCQASYCFMLNESNEYFLVTDLVIPDAITSIGDYQFYGFNALESITIPNSVTSIGSSAFYMCSSLTSIVIPESVTSIGEDAFNFCSSLTSIVIPNSVTSIGDYTFYNCSSLTSIEIGDSVTSIGDRAFYFCYSLTNIIIPNSVTSIGEKAFYFCDSLTSIVIPNSVTSIGSHVFAGCEKLKIYCEARSKPSGWDSYWNSWGNHVVWGYKK